ncbi:MAG: DUF1549 domain-containing protein [Bryobacterales bacterium]|nr:DUF1549 domain-containing protein [Bryobacterales bacterium]
MRPVWIGLLCAAAALADDAPKLLASKCWACHAQTAMAGLRLDSRDAMLRGGVSGPALVPGDPAASRLYRAVARTDPAVKPMPPGAPLSAADLATIETWIRDGAPWDSGVEHWAFRPLERARAGDSIDRFIQTALRRKTLAPNPPADRRTLIRRLSFDLTGLPPDPGDPAFHETRPDWFARLADRLLASPRFGEKWGRHWLDVARYGEDDYSGTAVIPYPNAWRYRDWVIEALNQDMPYDRFVMAQIAGDLMDDAALLPATGFF